MCWGIYLVADRPLPEIGESDPDFPAFAVRQVEDDRTAKVRQATGAQHVYSAASWQGCGCGFSYETDAVFKDRLASVADEPALERLFRANRAAELASVRSLSRYVGQAASDGVLAVYAVDESHVGCEPTVRQSVSPSFFGGSSFDFGDGAAMFEPTGLYEVEGPHPELRAV